MVDRKKTGIGPLAFVILAVVFILIIYKVLFIYSPEYHASNATQYYNEGDNEKAIAEFNKALEMDPNYAWAYVGRGIVYSSLKEPERAIADITRGLEKVGDGADSTFVEIDKAYMSRGEAYFTLKMFDEAIEDYKIAIDLNPDFYVPYGMCGMAYQEKGDYDNAIAFYNGALDHNFKVAKLHFIKARACEHEKRYRDAIDSYNDFIENAEGEEQERIEEVEKRIVWLKGQLGTTFF